MLLGCRAMSALCLGAALALPLPWSWGVGLVLLAAPSIGMGDLATTLVLTAVSPAGRATTLTLRSAAVCIGTAMGGIVGGMLLVLGDYAALGVCSLIMLMLATMLVWLARPQPTPSVSPA